MRRASVVTAATVTALALLLTGCSQQLQDRKGGAGHDPDQLSDVDYVEVHRNIDNFPNVAKVCAGGVAFATTSSSDGKTSASLIRVPEWDTGCPGSASPSSTPSPSTAP